MLAIPLGWMQLKHQKMRLLVALAGIAFAVILICMQLGFRASLFESAARYQQRLDYDIALFGRESPIIVNPRSFSSRRLYQTLAVEGVESVVPLYVEPATWRNPETNEVRTIFVVGLSPANDVLRTPGVSEQLGKLKRRDVFLYDALSRPEYGPIAESFRAGESVSLEVNNRTMRLVGLYEMGTSFGIDGAMLTSDDNFLRLFPQRQRTQIDLGLLKLAPGTDLKQAQAAIRQLVPRDVLVLSKAEFISREKTYWNSTTPIGYVFAFGAVMGFVVGAIIVYQILFADVSDHLAEYATLKAMGYSNRFVSGVVIQQAVILALLGYLPGLAISVWLYKNAAEATQLPIVMTPERGVTVLVLTILMCTISGLIALRKVRSLDPADVF